jgi:hypothetical protein
MITIIHGDDLTSSRKYYIDLKLKYPQAETLDGANANLADLVQILEGGSLFNDEKIIFIEQLVSKKKSSIDYINIIKYLSNPLSSVKIFLWEGKELEKSALTPFTQSTIKSFKLPRLLFTFLDNIKPNNTKQLLQLFHQTLSNSDEETIFYMLIRQIRLLLALSSPCHSGDPDKVGRLQNPDSGQVPIESEQARMTSEIDELKRLQPWQQSKLEQQSKLFSLEKLITIYNRFYEIESAYKTGNLPSTLNCAIDILLLEL